MDVYTFHPHMPDFPLPGDNISLESGVVTPFRSRYRRLAGEDRFAVDAADGRAYEVVPVARRKPGGTPQTWRAVREIPLAELDALKPSDHEFD